MYLFSSYLRFFNMYGTICYIDYKVVKLFKYGHWNSHIEIKEEYKSFVYIIHITENGEDFAYIGYKKIKGNWKGYC
jgi:hypothetical protein